jgi:hypothetical protein
MKAEFEKYLETVGMTGILIARVEEFYKIYESLCPEEITGLFISEYRTSEGVREYEEVAFFSSNYIMASERFVQKDEFNMAFWGKSIHWWEIRSQDYDFKNATDKSRMSIEYTTVSGVSGDFKASGGNVTYLHQVFVQFFLPNMKGPE